MSDQPTTVSIQDVDQLVGVDLFAGLDRVALAQLASHLRREQVAAGTAVFSEGDEAEAFYLIEQGSFHVLLHSDEEGREVSVNTLEAGEYFGEVALLTNAPCTVTIRAASDGVLLKLARRDFVEFFHNRPSVASALIVTLSQRLRVVEQARAEDELAIQHMLSQRLTGLSPERRRHVLEASLLEMPTLAALEVMFGGDANEVETDLAALEIRPAVLAVLRDDLREELGPDHVAELVENVSLRLADAQRWEDALAMVARQGPRAEFLALLGRALRDVPALPHEQAMRWVERVTDDEAIYDPELALARASVLREHGKDHEAAQLVRRIMATGLLAQEGGDGQALAEALSHVLTDEADGLALSNARHFRLPLQAPSRTTALALALAAMCFLAAATVGRGNPQLSFLLLLGAAIVLWIVRAASQAIVALGLVAAWVLLGIAKPEQAVAGYASTTWLFVVAVLALSVAVARSGLLFRVGLLLMRRLPKSLFGQSTVLLSTGVLLTPLLPVGQGRVALTTPLALTLAQALELDDHDPRAAILGLSAWVGASPMTFMFMNGAPTTLLAWGMLPAADQARFDWLHWLLAALPLGLVCGLGTIALLILLLRPQRSVLPEHERLDLELAVLGRPGRRELAMLVVLAGTIAAWMAAGALKLDLAIIAVVGLLGAVASGNFAKRGLQELDWDFLVFFGAVLTVGSVAVSLGIDKLAAAGITNLLGYVGGGKLVFLAVVTVVTILVQLIISKGQAVLLLSLIFLPVAAQVGINAWVVAVIILATSSMWYYTAQTAGYALALSAGQGRLFTETQGRIAAFAFTAVLFVGIAVSVPYWRLLGLL